MSHYQEASLSKPDCTLGRQVVLLNEEKNPSLQDSQEELLGVATAPPAIERQYWQLLLVKEARWEGNMVSAQARGCPHSPTMGHTTHYSTMLYYTAHMAVYCYLIFLVMYLIQCMIQFNIRNSFPEIFMNPI